MIQRYNKIIILLLVVFAVSNAFAQQIKGVVTDSVTLNSSGNTVGSRKEYVVYGSMEGGLHIVDASTGEEKSVFVPKEVLDN